MPAAVRQEYWAAPGDDLSTLKVTLSYKKMRNFQGRQGNDASKALHHTRVCRGTPSTSHQPPSLGALRKTGIAQSE
jgi:hypothetical protein